LDTVPTSWQTYTDTAYSFQLQVGSYLDRTGPTPWNAGEDVLFMVSDSVHGWEQVWVYVDPNPATNWCTSVLSGTKVTVGPGITGYQKFVPFIPPPPSGGGGTNSPHSEISFLSSGVLMTFQLWGDPPASSYTARYGTQLQHLLASFAPGPAYPGAHACQ
jgi:hypothetical protein